MTSERRKNDSGHLIGIEGASGSRSRACLRTRSARNRPAAFPPIRPIPESVPITRSTRSPKSRMVRWRLATPMNSSWSEMKCRIKATRTARASDSGIRVCPRGRSQKALTFSAISPNETVERFAISSSVRASSRFSARLKTSSISSGVKARAASSQMISCTRRLSWSLPREAIWTLASTTSPGDESAI